MNRLDQLLKDRSDTRFHFIFGSGIQDFYLTPSGTPLTFLNALNTSLLSNAFDRILHISPTSVLRCLDEQSKHLSSHVLWTQRQQVIDGGLIEGIAQGPFGTNAIKSSQRESKPGLGDVHGVRLLDTLMTESEGIRTAAVIFDSLTFCAYFDSQRILFGILNEWRLLPAANKNECFFIIPGEDDSIIHDQLSHTFLDQFLLINQNKKKTSNFYRINPPHIDELKKVIMPHLRQGKSFELENNRLIRIIAAEQELLRTWEQRLGDVKGATISTFRQSGWIQTATNDIRSVQEQIEDLVGLKEIKSYIERLQNLSAYQRINDQEPIEISFHMVFYGNPGTGKTTIARLLGQIFQESGLLQRGHLVEVKGSDLIADHVGGTGMKIDSKINQAMDGILFIDEAYSLVGEERGGFGKEALEVLIKRMEDDRKRLVVILAGYKAEMLRFLQSNPGLERRFPVNNRIEFPDYSIDELESIFDIGVERKGIPIQHDMREIISNVIHELVQQKGKNFGNAGEIRNFIEAIEMQYKSRIGENPQGDVHLIDDDIPEHYLKKVQNVSVSIDELLAPLSDMKGLDHVKNELVSMAKLIKIHLTKNAKKKNDKLSFLDNYLFLGNPGTGKTTTARVMGQMLYSLGVLKNQSIVEVTAVDLIAGFVGQTPEKTKRVIESALDGVLFIDEAYALNRFEASQTSNFGQEAIDTLVKMIDQYKHRIVVILAGYPNEMVGLLRTNPGLSSRFTKVIHFPDLDDEELGSVLQDLCDNEGYILPLVVFHRAVDFLGQIRSLSPRTFGNAREVHKLFKHMAMSLANRIVKDQEIHQKDLNLPTGWNILNEHDVDGYDIVVDPSPNFFDLASTYPSEGFIKKKKR